MPAESFEEEGLERIPDLRLSQWLFEASLNRTTVKSRSRLVNLIMDVVRSENMTPFYKIVCKQLHLLDSQQLMGEMQRANDDRLEELDENIKKAEESDGETEIREAMIAKAHYLSKIGNKMDALAQFRAILDKTVLPGCRLDITFHLIRMGFFYNDRDLITTNIEKANSLIEEGGDWDRRNRLKVYRGLHSLSIRDFNASAKHFLDAVATFTSYELMDYKSFIIYTVLTSMIALKRQDLRAKVIMGSEIQEVLHSLPAVREYLMSLFECRYADFFLYLAGVEQFMHSDRYLAAHARYYVREMRIRAYTQHLDSYSSLSLESMAATFGVTMSFLDAELSRFIANGRIACKIDKVTGIVETTRPDNVNSQYQAIIKHGDVLLNRIQKLSQVINI
ncbi:26S proteasome non-ATPase regulatory subunit 6 [Echinococcus granulosus]|uniref:26S proteasome non-ATPase regulatory subunit 6 n=1 Tax=Echinococcus granulosus TaxID=6210 RepID=U6IYU3_ECHGR|nr:26S proteasome non-ATPase regulatory subunit 6 [Echinococcus granulosus]EUB63030.1 26S proteasome non-ATPase regulatory subunit 6 [Echinococcus granulosus]KAH9282769.1 26S proteasome non-ATPase regulatory subunit 6 [Echinococcus granulosus]CDS16893.1 26S proteasome non ATPase regulatory subunit 6 [Echinococcus granulosus]